MLALRSVEKRAATVSLGWSIRALRTKKKRWIKRSDSWPKHTHKAQKLWAPRQDERRVLFTPTMNSPNNIASALSSKSQVDGAYKWWNISASARDKLQVRRMCSVQCVNRHGSCRGRARLDCRLSETGVNQQYCIPYKYWDCRCSEINDQVEIEII